MCSTYFETITLIAATVAVFAMGVIVVGTFINLLTD